MLPRPLLLPTISEDPIFVIGRTPLVIQGEPCSILIVSSQNILKDIDYFTTMQHISIIISWKSTRKIID